MKTNDFKLPPLPTIGGLQEAMKFGPERVGKLMQSYARAAVDTYIKHGKGGMTTKTDTEITKNEYLCRCSKRLIERSDINEKTALEVAESIWENSIDRTAPEGDADEELSYWGD